MHRTRIVLAAATALVCGVVAGVVVAAALAGGPGDSHVRQPCPARSTDCPAPDATPDRLRLTDLPLGPPPRVGYVADGVYVAPGGRRTRVPDRYGISGIVPWRGGFLVADTRWFEGTLGITYVDAAGRRVHEWPSSGAPVGGTDRRVAWTAVTVSEASRPGPTRVHMATADGRHLAQTLRAGIIQVHGFVGDRVLFSRLWGQGIFLTDLRHPPDRLSWWPRRVHPGAVSPDGTRMLGLRGHEVRVYDVASGNLLVTVPLPREVGLDGALVWEDDRTLLGVAVHARRAAVVRLDLEGNLSRATPIRHSGPFAPTYALGSAP